MKLQDYLNVKDLESMIDLGYINKVYHPTLPLVLYNYTQECQYSRTWNPVTMKCRGLVVDKDNNIVARPFEKFFNYEELDDLGIIPPSNLSFDIYEKMDGSLGILFWYSGQWIICTRGSFESDQAKHAQEIFNRKYLGQAQFDLSTKKTYLFEIIYPSDPHIVSYAGVDDIFLLAVINTRTGEEECIYNYTSLFKCTKYYKDYDWKNIRTLFDGDNREGFVVRFFNGFRMKIKFEEYFKLSSFKSNLSEKKVFEYLSNGNEDELDGMIKKLPEETQIWCKNIKDQLHNNWRRYMEEARDYYKERPDFYIEEGEKLSKEAAEFYKTSHLNPIIFALANHKSEKTIESITWKLIKYDKGM